jgi:hypothetical protein
MYRSKMQPVHFFFAKSYRIKKYNELGVVHKLTNVNLLILTVTKEITWKMCTKIKRLFWAMFIYFEDRQFQESAVGYMQDEGRKNSTDTISWKRIPVSNLITGGAPMRMFRQMVAAQELQLRNQNIASLIGKKSK